VGWPRFAGENAKNGRKILELLRLKTHAAATIVSLGALLFTASALAQTTPQTTDTQTEAVSLSQYGDWTYGCSGGECTMQQQLGNPEQPDILYGIADVLPENLLI
jgi:invasion protein IalB